MHSLSIQKYVVKERHPDTQGETPCTLKIDKQQLSSSVKSGVRLLLPFWLES